MRFLSFLMLFGMLMFIQKTRKGQEKDMKRNKKSKKWAGVGVLAAFIVWTVLIQVVDVQPIGPNETEVGFAALNGWFHEMTGVHWMLYVVTDWMGLVPLAVCAGFGFIGLTQWIQRKNLMTVDADILLLGAYYVAVIAAYLLFEQFSINYRPVLVEGRLEASYPSSTTLLVLGVMSTGGFQVERRIRSKPISKALRIISACFSAFMVVGRLLSGVHWLTDIIGAVLLSMGMFLIYRGAVLRIDARERKRKQIGTA